MRADLAQLLYGRHALQVCRDNEDFFLFLLFEVGRQLSGRCRFARALQPGHQDDGRRVGGENEALVALGLEQIVQGMAHGVEELVLTDARFFRIELDAVDEFFDDLVVDAWRRARYEKSGHR